MLNWGDYKPNAIEFSKLIRKKIIPLVEKKYAIADGMENRAIVGASLEGLFAMWDGITSPIYWGTVIAMSP